jgi:hypothetical protein
VAWLQAMVAAERELGGKPERGDKPRAKAAARA